MFFLLVVFVICGYFSYGQFLNGINVISVLFDNGNFNVFWMYNRIIDELFFVVDVNMIGWVGFGFIFMLENMVNYDVIVGGWMSVGQDYLNVSYLFICLFFCVLKFFFVMFNLYFFFGMFRMIKN